MQKDPFQYPTQLENFILLEKLKEAENMSSDVFGSTEPDTDKDSKSNTSGGDSSEENVGKVSLAFMIMGY